jgi:2-phosphoglycerate kinase
MKNDDHIVIEGIHKNPNNIDTLDHKTKTFMALLIKKKQRKLAKGLIQKNIDNFYHRAW